MKALYEKLLKIVKKFQQILKSHVLGFEPQKFD